MSNFLETDLDEFNVLKARFEYGTEFKTIAQRTGIHIKTVKQIAGHTHSYLSYCRLKKYFEPDSRVHTEEETKQTIKNKNRPSKRKLQVYSKEHYSILKEKFETHQTLTQIANKLGMSFSMVQRYSKMADAESVYHKLKQKYEHNIDINLDKTEHVVNKHIKLSEHTNNCIKKAIEHNYTDQEIINESEKLGIKGVNRAKVKKIRESTPVDMEHLKSVLVNQNIKPVAKVSDEKKALNLITNCHRLNNPFSIDGRTHLFEAATALTECKEQHIRQVLATLIANYVTSEQASNIPRKFNETPSVDYAYELGNYRPTWNDPYS